MIIVCCAPTVKQIASVPSVGRLQVCICGVQTDTILTPTASNAMQTKHRKTGKINAMAKKLFKILVRGYSRHGGNFKYSLPRCVDGEWVPGKWHSIGKKELDLCTTGFHATPYPYSWWLPGAKAYIAEISERHIWSYEKTKVCAADIRLLRPALPKELAKHGVYIDGKHSIKHKCGICTGTADVKVHGGMLNVYGGKVTLLKDAQADISCPCEVIVEQGGKASLCLPIGYKGTKEIIVRVRSGGLLSARDTDAGAYTQTDSNTWVSTNKVKVINEGGQIRW